MIYLSVLNSGSCVKKKLTAIHNVIKPKLSFLFLFNPAVEEADSTCTDNPELANCILIVAANYCTVKPYDEFCCRTCRDNGFGRR